MRDGYAVEFKVPPSRFSRDPVGTGQQSLQVEIGTPSGRGIGTGSGRRYKNSEAQAGACPPSGCEEFTATRC
jgi:hypothetical protein